MLIEFRVANHRSIRDEQVLSMEAGRVDVDTDGHPRQVSGHASAILPVAAIYGANASGKSNVLHAISFMSEAVLLSHRMWSPDAGVPSESFAWGPAKSEPSLYEATFLSGGVKFQYGFVASSEAFLEEWLYAWPNGKKQTWFERDKDNFKFGENLRGENRLIEEVTRSNALFISAAVQHRHAQLEPVFSWFRAIRRNFRAGQRFARTGGLDAAQVFDRDSNQRTLFPDTELLSETESLANGFRALLKSADIGIVDVRVTTSESDNPRRARRTMFYLQHQSDMEDSWLPLEEESQGTQTLFRLALPILQTIRRGGILLVDELESSLHPAVAQQIVQQFNNPETNPQNAQLIFTTHDTNLLGTIQGDPTLRRDQVWLTEKDSEGASVLYPLTDFKPRKSENLERGYLQGRYGAIPFLGDFEVARK